MITRLDEKVVVDTPVLVVVNDGSQVAAEELVVGQVMSLAAARGLTLAAANCHYYKVGSCMGHLQDRCR